MTLGDPDEIDAAIRRLVDLGIDGVTLNLAANTHDPMIALAGQAVRAALGSRRFGDTCVRLALRRSQPSPRDNLVACDNRAMGERRLRSQSAVAGSIATAGSVAVAGSVATAGSVAVAGSVATAGGVAVAGSVATAGSAAVAGSVLTLFSAGIRACVAVIACVRCTRCVACVGCIDCSNCVGCVGCVGLRNAVGQRGRRAA